VKQREETILRIIGAVFSTVVVVGTLAALALLTLIVWSNL
jgi:hypothetical protein